MPVRYPMEFFQELFTSRYVGLIGYDKETTEVIGFATGRKEGKNAAYITTLGILPEYQGMGFGTLILRQLVANLKTKGYITSISLHVKRNNLKAIE